MDHPSPSKPYDEQTVDERVAALDRVLNVLCHQDWRELYFRWSADAATLQRIMNEARTWDEFVDARGAKAYIDNCLLRLREQVTDEKAMLEREKTDPLILPPTDYEID